MGLELLWCSSWATIEGLLLSKFAQRGQVSINPADQANCTLSLVTVLKWSSFPSEPLAKVAIPNPRGALHENQIVRSLGIMSRTLSCRWWEPFVLSLLVDIDIGSSGRRCWALGCERSWLLFHGNSCISTGQDRAPRARAQSSWGYLHRLIII